MFTIEGVEKELIETFAGFNPDDDLINKKLTVKHLDVLAGALVEAYEEEREPFKNSPEGKAQQKEKLQKTIELLQKKLDSL